MVASIDHVATGVGVEILRMGGSAADAAVATNAVLAVTSPYACGMGGDLLAVVKPPVGDPVALNASGRAGSGADPVRLRAEGARRMPMAGDIRSVPIPGCVDGWLALHQRFWRLPLGDILEPARLLATEGFAASVDLAGAAPLVSALPCGADLRGPLRPGAVVTRPGVGRALAAIAGDGRAGYYGGAFGEGLLALGAGEYTPADLQRPLADWVAPATLSAWGVDLWTVPPNSQGYLTLAGAWLAQHLELGDPAGPRWPHLLAEAARAAGRDRPSVLWEGADAASLLSLARLQRLGAAIEPERAGTGGAGRSHGDTTHLCVVDTDRMAVSLTQSNAQGFGSQLAVDGIFLHNRGLGFSLEQGHPAEYGPGRRPPHTLSPAMVTTSGDLHTVIGTMGGDTQPQILLQLLARLLAGERPAAAVNAGRWALLGGADNPADPERPLSTGFDTWDGDGPTWMRVEEHAPPSWISGLRSLGHRVVVDPAYSSAFGHAHIIQAHDTHLEGASDPRASASSAAGY
jgi:gamma-glutamyltranspeptidase/glutathione hydrolase